MVDMNYSYASKSVTGSGDYYIIEDDLDSSSDDPRIVATANTVQDAKLIVNALNS